MKKQIINNVKIVCMLCCVSTIAMALLTTCAFALPLQQDKTQTSSKNAISYSTAFQDKVSLSSGLINNLSKNSTVGPCTKNLNENHLTICQTSQSATLGETSITSPIGSVKIGTYTFEFTDVSAFVNAISCVTEADVYLYRDVALNNTIKIQTQANVTIHLCGHVLSGKNISSAPIIEVGYRANLTVIGSENETQRCQVHTLTGFGVNGEIKPYSNICGGVINAGHVDDVIGIYIPTNNSTVTLKETTIFGCVDTENNDTENNGGGIDISGKNTRLNLDLSSIQHCRAQSGGAIYVSPEADNTYISLFGSSINYNHADDFGAGIYCNAEKTTLNLFHSHIQNCKANYGGGVCIGDTATNSSISMAYSSIDNNQANECGGGISCYAEGVTIEDTAYNPDDESTRSTISNNIADEDGGGIHSNGSGLKVHGLDINNNHANNGGAAYIDSQKNTIDNCSLKNNTATNNGGGACVDDTNNTFIGCIFTGNKAKTGGGICINKYDDNTAVSSCGFYYNTADEDGGGAYVNSEENTFKECTFTGNTSAEAGSALYDNNDDNTLKDCTITDNNSNAKTGAVYVCNTVDITLAGYVNISSNTGHDVYLASGFWELVRAHILIDPNKFDISSHIGISLYCNTANIVCVTSTGGDISMFAGCFFCNEEGYGIYYSEDNSALATLKN